MILCASTDGVPPEEYEPYNRAAFGMLWIALSGVLPIVGCVTYVLARLQVGSRLLSLLLAQLPAVALAAVLVARS